MVGVSALVIDGAVMAVAACSSSSKSSASTSTTLASAATATLAVVTNTRLAKQIIVDGSGKTVYLYMPDGTSTTSKVPAGLKAAWPALTVSGAPTVGAGLEKIEQRSRPSARA